MGAGTKLMAGVGVAGITIVGMRGMRLYSMGNKLQISHRARVSEVGLSGMTLTIDVVIKNPTSGSLTIKYPFLKVMLGNKQLAASEVQNADISIKPNGATEINNITFRLTTMQEISIAASLLIPLVSGQQVKIKAVTDSGVKFLFWHIPFTEQEEIIINNPA